MKMGYCGFFLSLLLAINATAAVQDQVQTSFGSWADLRPGGSKVELAQTFKPGIAGRLVAFQHDGISPSGVAEYPTTFSLVNTVNGQPGTNILGMSVVTNLSAQTMVYFTNSSIYLDTNTSYGMILSTEAPLTSSREYSSRTSYGDAYPRGSLWSRQPGGVWSLASVDISPDTPMDLVFATYMDPGIPAVRMIEPTAGSMLLIGKPVELAAALSSQITNATSVSFYSSDSYLGSVTNQPFTLKWTPPTTGNFDLTAVLETGSGKSVTSAPCLVTVTLPRPANDDFANRIQLSGEVQTSPINQTNATVESGEPRPFSDSAGKTVWWQWTAPRSGWVSITVSGTAKTNALLSLFSGSDVAALQLLTNHPAFIAASVQAGASYQISLDSVSNTIVNGSLMVALNDIEISSPVPNTVFHAPAAFTLQGTRTATARQLVSVDTLINGSPVGQLAPPSYELPCSLANPGYYDLQLTATDTNRVKTFSSAVPIIVRPANDDFQDAEVISGRDLAIHASNMAATMQSSSSGIPGTTNLVSGDPTWAQNQGGHSIWYKWTAPANGVCVIDGRGTNFALLFNVCVGTASGSVAVVAANALVPPYNNVQFDAVSGTTYFISVDGYFGEEGPLDWTLQLQPYNDDFADRRLITGLSSTILDSNDGATTQQAEAGLLPTGTGSSLWYSWQAPISGDVVVSASGTNALALAAYTGTALSNLTFVAQSSGTWTNAASLRFSAQSGTTYQIAVFGLIGQTGNFTFHLAWQGLRLSSPLPNSIFPAPAKLHLAAELDVTNKSLQQVTFLANDQPIGSALNPPFTLDWRVPRPGAYTLSAKGLASGNTHYQSAPLTCLIYANKHLPSPHVYSAISSDCSYVINAVGALYLFGGNPDQFGRSATNLASTPFLGAWPAGVSGWKEISGSWAVSDSGQLYQNGQILVPLPSGVTAWQHVSLGFGGMVAVGNDGNLYLNGKALIDVPQPPGGWRDARASLANVNNVVLGLGADSEAYLVSRNTYGQWSETQLSRPSGVTGWKAIAQAALFSVLLTDSDQLYIYGEYGGVTGTSGQAGFVAVPRPAGVNHWVDFAAGGYHVLAIGDNGQLYAWGRNWEHQLGIGLDQNARATPVLVTPPAGVTAWSSVAAGQFHSLAIGDDCSLYAWGANGSGQLGQPNTISFSRPTRVASLQALCGTPVLFTDGNSSRQSDNSFRLEFNTDLNRTYIIQYSDNMRVWKNATTVVTGTGGLVQWTDNGPPNTESNPSSVPMRAYRVIYAP